jgi:acylphosphatase
VPVVHVEVAGRVQGVGFRWFVREHARQLQIAGWVRNLSSGNVEVAASGTDAAIQTLLDILLKGPPGADVRQLIRLPASPSLDLPQPFTVLK